jgi:hypothetical protein
LESARAATAAPSVRTNNPINEITALLRSIVVP